MNSRNSCTYRLATEIFCAHPTACSRVGNSRTVNLPLILLPG
jgi:hypothetical protein